MDVTKLKDMHRGWFIGNFDPSVLNTEDFEVGVLTHLKDEKWPAHYHKVGTEYNVLLSGRMRVCDTELFEGDIFTIKPYEVADPTFYEDCTILCVKVPSNTQDKIMVDTE
jgi:quercetin dioxygenase-like cupin family protein|tara:strand:+ start:923 stop:1252 length:330 start_codon:yes stop_codon:yes gene_type:complete